MKSIDLEDETRLSPCRKNLFAFVSLSLLVLMVYSNSLDVSWHLDDGPNIVENQRLHLRNLSWADIRRASLSGPSSSGVEFFRPLSRLSLALNYYVGGTDVFGYHAVNISIHLMAGFFLYLFLLHALRLPVPTALYGESSYFVALLAAAFWVIHPIQTQAVTYVVQRMTSLAALFYILSMYFYVKARSAQGVGRKVFFHILCASAGILSMGSKENALLLPVSLFLLHLLLEVGVQKESLKKIFRTFAVTYGIPVLGCLAALFLFTDLVDRVFQLYETRPFSLWERLLTQQRVLVFYLSLLAYPTPERLSIDHDILISRSLLDPPSTFFSLVFILAVLATSSALTKRVPVLAFSVFFFFLNHALESTILPMEMIFEHRNYLPSMLLFLPVALGFLRLLSRFAQNRTLQMTILLFIVLLLVSLGHMSYLRNLAWKDEESLWTDCLNKYPHSFRAHHNLGRHFHLSGHILKAEEHYLAALKAGDLHSRKEKGTSYHNLGLVAQWRGHPDKALWCYQKAVEVNPCSPGTHNNLATLLLAHPEPDKRLILETLRKAIECGHEEEVPLALSNMGMVLLRTGNPDQGMEALRQAVKLDPLNPLSLLRLGVGYQEGGQGGRAFLHFQRSLSLDPGNITAHLCLAEVLFRKGLVERGKRALDFLLQSVSSRQISDYLFGIKKENPWMEIRPDMKLILPYLKEALFAKGLSFRNTHEHPVEPEWHRLDSIDDKKGKRHGTSSLP
jgi:Tfp pilus assembly protein PilF